MEEEWWSSVLKGGCVLLTHTLNTRVWISTKGWQGGVRCSGGKEHDRLVLVKKDMLCFVPDVRAVRGMGRNISDHHVVLCKVRLVVTLINRREVVDGAWSIKSEKLRVHQYKEGYARSL